MDALSSTGRRSAPSQVATPANPFSRTLATLESPAKLDRELQPRPSERPAAARAASSTTKASLDVEAFQRLLMTGDANPSSPSPSDARPTISSAAGAPSGLRSPQGPPPPAVTGNARTRPEIAGSSDDERPGASPTERKAAKAKPPPPKSRHGKSVTARAPQTVTFSDFTPSVPSQPSSPPSARDGAESDLSQARPTPLILSPASQAVSEDHSPVDALPAPATSSSSSHLDAPAAQKKVPPPPPIARRQSQLRSSSGNNRSRSSSSVTASSQHSNQSPLVSPDGPLHAPLQKGPPPPPTRRHGGPAGMGAVGTEPGPTSSPRRSTVTSAPSSRAAALSSPPPSPRLGVPLSRNASTASNRNARLRAHTAPGGPPPPPPPRRMASVAIRKHPSGERGSSPTVDEHTNHESKQGGTDGQRRCSITSETWLHLGSTKTPESSSPQHPPQDHDPEPPHMVDSRQPSNSSAVDILDDMDQFQREIDELRGRYEHVA